MDFLNAYGDLNIHLLHSSGATHQGGFANFAGTVDLFAHT